MTFIAFRRIQQGVRCFSAAAIAAGALALSGGRVPRTGAESGASPAHAPSLAPDDGRPVVIVVHGRGQLPGDSAAVRAQWSRVIQSRTSALAGTSVLRDDDVWVAWYADALDPLNPVVCTAETASDVTANGAQSEDARLREFFAAAGTGITAVLDLFDGYARDEARAIAGDLLFLGDPVRKCAAETELRNALARAAAEQRPVILVAHSFGSLLAYGYLASAVPDDSSAAEIHQFVTMGSLLGAPGARRLLLADHDSLPSLPHSVRAWTNITDPRDALAHPIRFDADADTTRARNLTTTPSAPESDPHDIVRYLRDPVTVRVVAGAWCDAFRWTERERPPAGCHTLADSR